MAAGFDPYYTWLGIAPEEQPPNHYRLLGIRLFEDNPEVISNAADRQMAHLRTFQTGSHATESQRLLNEVAASRVCLLKAEKKVEYDARLRATLPAPAEAQAEPALDAQLANVLAQELAPHPEAHSGVRPADRGHPHAHRLKKPLPLAVWVLMGLSAVAAVVLFALLLPSAAKMKKPQLLLDWAEAERQEATLTIDDQPYEVAATGEVAVALEPGEHRVEIRWPAYAPFDCAVFLRPGEDQTLAVNRRLLPGTVVLDWPVNERAGAGLSVDGKPQFVPASGEFRLKIEPGKHVLRLMRSDFQPIEQQVEVSAGAEIPLAVRWTKSGQSPDVPAAGPDRPLTGSGLTAKLFAKGNLAAPLLERKDVDVHCVWDGTPDAKLPAGEYSIHWSGWLKAPAAGRYKFAVRTDGQAKFWLDDRPLIADTANPQAEIELDTAPHAVHLEYDSRANHGYVILTWAPPVDKSQEQTVPAEAFFLDRASAEQATVASSVLTPPPDTSPPSADASQPIDLLRRVDIAQHKLVGNWWFRGKSLVCENSRPLSPSLIKLPVTWPAEYEVRMLVERWNPADSFVMGLVADGHRFDAVLDGWRQSYIRGVDRVDGKSVHDKSNETRAVGLVIPATKQVRLTYTVRKKRLTVARDGENVIDWPADYSRCSAPDPVDSSSWYLRIYSGVTQISQLELAPLSSEPGKTMASGAGMEQPKTAAPPTPRQPIPGDERRQEVTAALKAEFGGRTSDKQPFARLAWAAHLIEEARKREGKPEEQYVLLTRATDVALREGDCWLPLAAAEDLSKRFEVSAASLKIKILTEAASHARNTAALEMLADLGASLTKEALAAQAEDGLLDALGQLRQQAQKKRALPLAQAIQKRSARLEQAAAVCRASREALAASKNPAESSAAALKVGRYAALIEEDWDKALPLLAKSEDSRLAKPAAQLAANANDAAAQFAMGDAWSEIAAALKPRSSELSELAFGAARHWYELVLPRLAGEDLARVRGQLCADGNPEGRTTKRGAATPFKVPLHGLGGFSFMVPTKTSGGVRADGGFAAFQGQGGIEYAQIPSSAYIHELRLTFLVPRGYLDLFYGDVNQGAKLNFAWDDKKERFVCLFQAYRGGSWGWAGERHYKPKEPLRFSVFVNENQGSLLEGDNGVLGVVARPADLQLRIFSRENTQAVISQCEFRPWNRGEAQRLKWSMPPLRVAEARPHEAARRFHAGNYELGDRPNMRESKPFVVPTTGTPMQWIAAGSFQRENRHVSPTAKPTEIVISRGFWIGRYEVTQGEWTVLKGVNPSRVTGSPFLPVDGVSWHEAGQFCQDLTRQETKARRVPAGLVYRLPTEAEWEYACRAGSQSEFSVEGDNFWHAGNSGYRPHEVGEQKPNAWGLFDMHGNAEEWCLDAWRDLPNPPPLRLTDPVSLAGDKEEYFPLRSGGWWRRYPQNCASGLRDVNQSAPGGHRGFRFVLARAPGKSE